MIPLTYLQSIAQEQPRLEIVGESLISRSLKESWQFCHIDRDDNLFVQITKRPSVVYFVENFQSPDPLVRELRIAVADRKHPLLSSINILAQDKNVRLIATLNTGEILFGDKSGPLRSRPDLDLLVNGSLHKAGHDSWWLIESNNISLLNEKSRSPISGIAEAIEGDVVCAEVGLGGELLLRDQGGFLHVLSSDASLMTSYPLDSQYRSSCGMTGTGDRAIVFAQESALFCGINVETFLLPMTGFDRPIWRGFCYTPGRLLVAELREARVLQCYVYLPPENHGDDQRVRRRSLTTGPVSPCSLMSLGLDDGTAR